MSVGTEAKRDTQASLSKARVLIVDDEQMIGRTLRRALGQEHEVVVLDSGPSAKDLLARDQTFDVVLCDLMMPDVTGMDLFDWVRAHAPDLVQKMIFMTGGTFTTRATEFLTVSGAPHVEKPFDIPRLRAMIATLIQQQRQA